MTAMSLPDEPVGFAGVPLWMIRDEAIDRNMLLVFVALSSHLGRHDVVWPGQDTIAKEARLGVTSVKEALVRLRTAGVVQWRRRPTGNGYVNEYRILVSSLSRWDSRPAATPEGQPPDDRGTAAQRLQEQPLGGYEVDPQEADPPKNPSSPAGDAAFEKWWSYYPRKVGKIAARKAFDKALKTATLPELGVGLERAVADWSARSTPIEKIPHPSTWLNEGRWTDEYPEAGSAAAENGEDPNAWMHRKE